MCDENGMIYLDFQGLEKIYRMRALWKITWRGTIGEKSKLRVWERDSFVQKHWE